MSYRLWYRTYTEYTDIVPDLAAFDTYQEALDYSVEYTVQESERNDQYVRDIEIQHVQCGEMTQYCECEANA
jgi:hypothetical protein